jgi:hypothetical protein
MYNNRAVEEISADFVARGGTWLYQSLGISICMGLKFAFSPDSAQGTCWRHWCLSQTVLNYVAEVRLTHTAAGWKAVHVYAFSDCLVTKTFFIQWPYWESNHDFLAFQPQASHYTDWAISASLWINLINFWNYFKTIAVTVTRSISAWWGSTRDNYWSLCTGFLLSLSPSLPFPFIPNF